MSEQTLAKLVDEHYDKITAFTHSTILGAIGATANDAYKLGFTAGERAAREWQDIETAPKDGRRLLLWWPYWSALVPIVGWWQVNGGWQSNEALEGEAESPTHWMELPDTSSVRAKAPTAEREP